jgi:hypothetical protein
MARKIAELLIKLGADTLGIEKMSYDVRKQLKGLQKDIIKFGESWSLYVTESLTAVAGVAVKAADVQLKNEKRLLTALCGREDIQQRLIKQAGELQSRSLFGDEEIIGQQAFLASLGLTEQQINDTIEAAAQLSSATGMMLDSAVKNLAKTYGGLSGELGESIPKLKELTAEQMKNGEAVKFILENYKGFAETLAKTGTGPLKQLWMAIGDLAEEFGKVLMPAVQYAAEAIKSFVKWLQDLSPVAKTTIVVLSGLATSLGPATLAWSMILKILPSIKLAFAALTGPVGLVTTAIAAATAAIIGFNAAKKQAFSDEADKLVEKWRDGDYTPEQLAELRKRKESRVSALKTSIYYDQKSNAYDPDKPGRIRADKEKIEQLEIEIEAISRLIKIKEAEADNNRPISGLDEEIGLKEVGLIEKLTSDIKKLEEAKQKATSTMEIHNLTLEIATLRDELSKLQQIGAAESIAGDTGNLFGKGGISPLAFDPDAINPPAEEWETARQRFAANLSGFVSEAQNQVLNVLPAIRNLLSGVGTAIGEGLGNILSGDGTFEDLLGGIVKVMGQFLKSLGQQMIQLGIEMLQIKSALAASFSTPWAAIVAGVAAIAAGQAMINSFNRRNEGGVALAEGGLAYGPTMALVGDNRGAGSDPEVIAPLSKLRQYGLGHQTIEFVGGTFRLSGSDLVLAISREQAKINYVNALA